MLQALPRSLSNTFHDVQRPLLGDGLLDVEDGGDDVGVEPVHVRRQPGAVGVAAARSIVIVVSPSPWSLLVLQKVPSEANPKVRNHGEGPY